MVNLDLSLFNSQTNNIKCEVEDVDDVKQLTPNELLLSMFNFNQAPVDDSSDSLVKSDAVENDILPASQPNLSTLKALLSLRFPNMPNQPSAVTAQNLFSANSPSSTPRLPAKRPTILAAKKHANDANGITPLKPITPTSNTGSVIGIRQPPAAAPVNSTPSTNPSSPAPGSLATLNPLLANALSSLKARSSLSPASSRRHSTASYPKKSSPSLSTRPPVARSPLPCNPPAAGAAPFTAPFPFAATVEREAAAMVKYREANNLSPLALDGLGRPSRLAGPVTLETPVVTTTVDQDGGSSSTTASHLVSFNGTTTEVPDEIRCHLCDYPMKICFRKSKYKSEIREYPAYRCLRKGCQTFRAIRKVIDPNSSQAAPRRRPLKKTADAMEMNITDQVGALLDSCVPLPTPAKVVKLEAEDCEEDTKSRPRRGAFRNLLEQFQEHPPVVITIPSSPEPLSSSSTSQSPTLESSPETSSTFSPSPLFWSTATPPTSSSYPSISSLLAYHQLSNASHQHPLASSTSLDPAPLPDTQPDDCDDDVVFIEHVQGYSAFGMSTANRRWDAAYPTMQSIQRPPALRTPSIHALLALFTADNLPVDEESSFDPDIDFSQLFPPSSST